MSFAREVENSSHPDKNSGDGQQSQDVPAKSQAEEAPASKRDPFAGLVPPGGPLWVLAHRDPGFLQRRYRERTAGRHTPENSEPKREAVSPKSNGTLSVSPGESTPAPCSSLKEARELLLNRLKRDTGLHEGALAHITFGALNRSRRSFGLFAKIYSFSDEANNLITSLLNLCRQRDEATGPDDYLFPGTERARVTQTPARRTKPVYRPTSLLPPVSGTPAPLVAPTPIFSAKPTTAPETRAEERQSAPDESTLAAAAVTLTEELVSAMENCASRLEEPRRQLRQITEAWVNGDGTLYAEQGGAQVSKIFDITKNLWNTVDRLRWDTSQKVDLDLCSRASNSRSSLLLTLEIFNSVHFPTLLEKNGNWHPQARDDAKSALSIIEKECVALRDSLQAAGVTIK